MIAPADWLRAVIETARLTAASHVRVACAVAFLADDDQIRITMASLARLANVSPAVAAKASTRLENAGFLIWEHADFKPAPFCDTGWRRAPILFRLTLPRPRVLTAPANTAHVWEARA